MDFTGVTWKRIKDVKRLSLTVVFFAVRLLSMVFIREIFWCWMSEIFAIWLLGSSESGLVRMPNTFEWLLGILSCSWFFEVLPRVFPLKHGKIQPPKAGKTHIPLLAGFLFFLGWPVHSHKRYGPSSMQDPDIMECPSVWLWINGPLTCQENLFFSGLPPHDLTLLQAKRIPAVEDYESEEDSVLLALEDLESEFIMEYDMYVPPWAFNKKLWPWSHKM